MRIVVTEKGQDVRRDLYLNEKPGRNDNIITEELIA
jgi:hypothetical protein